MIFEGILPALGLDRYHRAMIRLTKDQKQTQGFALVVVLSMLAVLTLLFAISSKLSLAHVQRQSADLLIAQRSYAKSEVALAAQQAFVGVDYPSGLPETLQVRLGDDHVAVEVVDVGGLVDLNTAQPKLVEAVFQTLGLGSEDLETYRTWRQDGRRLSKVDDLVGITGHVEIDTQLLRRFTTVHSGRRGISTAHAPEELLEALSESLRIDDYPSEPSGANASLFFTDQSSGAMLRAGVIHAPQTNERARLLLVD